MVIMTREQVSENARKIFTNEYAVLFDLITRDIKKRNQMDEAEKLIQDIGKTIDGNNAMVALAVLSVHIITLSNDFKITNAIDEIKKKRDLMVT